MPGLKYHTNDSIANWPERGDEMAKTITKICLTTHKTSVDRQREKRTSSLTPIYTEGHAGKFRRAMFYEWYYFTKYDALYLQLYYTVTRVLLLRSFTYSSGWMGLCFSVRSDTRSSSCARHNALLPIELYHQLDIRRRFLLHRTHFGRPSQTSLLRLPAWPGRLPLLRAAADAASCTQSASLSVTGQIDQTSTYQLARAASQC